MIHAGIRYPVALDSQGRLRWAEERDKTERYTCLGCGAPMLLKVGSIRRPHFAHRAENLTCGGETVLHQMAKVTAADAIRRRCPVIYICPVCRFVIRYPTGFLIPEEEAAIGPWRVDLFLHADPHPFLALEIVVSHPPDDEKIQGLLKRGVPIGILRLTSFENLRGWRHALPLSEARGLSCPGPWHPLPEDTDFRITIWEKQWCRCGGCPQLWIEPLRLPAGESALERLAAEIRSFLRTGIDRMERQKYHIKPQVRNPNLWVDIRAMALERVGQSQGLQRNAIRRARIALDSRDRVFVQRCLNCDEERVMEAFRRRKALEARFFEALRDLGFLELPAMDANLAMGWEGDGPQDGKLMVQIDFRIAQEIPVQIEAMPVRAWAAAASWGKIILHAPPWASPCRRCGRMPGKERWLRREERRAIWLCAACAEQDEMALGPFQRISQPLPPAQLRSGHRVG